MTPVAKSQVVQALARQVGFDLAGVAPATQSCRAEYYRDWLAAGHGGTMEYLQRNVPVRLDPAQLLPGARSVICVALNHRRSDGYRRPRTPATTAPTQPPTGVIAQYARGRDYHVVLRRMLGELVGRLRDQLAESFETRICVDTAPVLERELAVAAGLGWFGRNTCVLNPELGSYLFLGEVITTLELAPGTPLAERCGACRRCLEACPTGAFIGPFQLSAEKCISYLTVEYRGEIPAELSAGIGDRVFGCDLCQQVCPYNARTPPASHPEIAVDILPERVNLLDIIKLRSGSYRRLTRGTAAARARREMWRRNAAIALANLGRTARGPAT